MNKNLSQIVAELFAKPLAGKELSDQVQRLGGEMRNMIRSEDTMSGKFNGLLESFRTIIADERQRYQAALQALSTTSKLSRQEIVKAINGQVDELKIVEKGMMPAQTGWRGELAAMEGRLQQVKGEIAQLRGRLTQLEGEEKTIQAGMSAKEKDLSASEKLVKDLFAEIGAEISALGRKIEEMTAEGGTQPPVAPAATPAASAVQPALKKEPRKAAVAPSKKKEEEQPVEIQTAPQPQDTKFQRKCPMCGGPFNLLALENIWQCYTCAYEEPNKG